MGIPSRKLRVEKLFADVHDLFYDYIMFNEFLNRCLLFFRSSTRHRSTVVIAGVSQTFFADHVESQKFSLVTFDGEIHKDRTHRPSTHGLP